MNLFNKKRIHILGFLRKLGSPASVDKKNTSGDIQTKLQADHTFQTNTSLPRITEDRKISIESVGNVGPCFSNSEQPRPNVGEVVSGSRLKQRILAAQKFASQVQVSCQNPNDKDLDACNVQYLAALAKLLSYKHQLAIEYPALNSKASSMTEVVLHLSFIDVMLPNLISNKSETMVSDHDSQVQVDIQRSELMGNDFDAGTLQYAAVLAKLLPHTHQLAIEYPSITIEKILKVDVVLDPIYCGHFSTDAMLVKNMARFRDTVVGYNTGNNDTEAEILVSHLKPGEKEFDAHIQQYLAALVKLITFKSQLAIGYSSRNSEAASKKEPALWPITGILDRYNTKVVLPNPRPRYMFQCFLIDNCLPFIVHRSAEVSDQTANSLVSLDTCKTLAFRGLNVMHKHIPVRLHFITDWDLQYITVAAKPLEYVRRVMKMQPLASDITDHRTVIKNGRYPEFNAKKPVGSRIFLAKTIRQPGPKPDEYSTTSESFEHSDLQDRIDNDLKINDLEADDIVNTDKCLRNNDVKTADVTVKKKKSLFKRICGVFKMCLCGKPTNKKRDHKC